MSNEEILAGDQAKHGRGFWFYTSAMAVGAVVGEGLTVLFGNLLKRIGSNTTPNV